MKTSQFKVLDYSWSQQGFLGKGSFGQVYKGLNDKTGEPVAIKIIDMSMFHDPFLVQQLHNEIDIQKKLTSQNIVRMFDAINLQSQTYIFLEFCGEGDLGKIIQAQGGYLSESQAVNILNQITKGFYNMVKLGYIHRDVKPENILCSKGVFKVADFGFATRADTKSIQKMKEHVGTPLYMSPQLLENLEYTAKSDIWSIGMMFFEMIFGRTPWPARDQKSFLNNIKTTPLRFPYDKPISEVSKNFISQCLQIDESQRIGWEDFFKHKIFSQSESQSKQAQQNVVQFDEKSKQILKSIQEIVQVHGLDIMNIFKNFDKDNGGTLSIEEFHQLCLVLDPRITSHESKYIFKKLDTSKDGQLQVDEFKKIFCEYDFSDTMDKAFYIIRDLKEIIKAHNLNMQQIFNNFDLDKQGDLDIQEFTKLLRVIAPKIKDHEIKDCFKRFDINKDGTISFIEFKQQLTHGIKTQDANYDPYKEKAYKIIFHLKRIIKEHKLDTAKIFSNFDKSKDKELDLNEFKKLILIIDNKLPDDEIKYIFNLFDVNKDGSITMQEFDKLVQ